MSNIYITEYGGDPEEYDKHGNAHPGAVDADTIYTDGEEFAAAAHILELLDTGIHFDVRQDRY